MTTPAISLPQVSTIGCWLAILASFVLSFATWLALGELAGFGALAVAMPFCVDGYTVTALTTWLSPGVGERLARFAKYNLYAVGGLGMLAQGSYHAWLAAHAPAASDGKTALAFVVGLFPMAIATLAVHIRAWAARDRITAVAPQPSSALPVPAPEQPAPLPVSATQPTLAAPYRASMSPLPAVRLSEPELTPVSPQPDNVTPAAKATVHPPRAPAAPQRKVDQSGSGAPAHGTSLADVRKWVDVEGLTHAQVAERLGVSVRTAARRIADARATDKPASLTVVPA